MCRSVVMLHVPHALLRAVPNFAQTFFKLRMRACAMKGLTLPSGDWWILV